MFCSGSHSWEEAEWGLELDSGSDVSAINHRSSLFQDKTAMVNLISPIPAYQSQASSATPNAALASPDSSV